MAAASPSLQLTRLFLLHPGSHTHSGIYCTPRDTEWLVSPVQFSLEKQTTTTATNSRKSWAFWGVFRPFSPKKSRIHETLTKSWGMWTLSEQVPLVLSNLHPVERKKCSWGGEEEGSWVHSSEVPESGPGSLFLGLRAVLLPGTVLEKEIQS